MKGNEGTVGMMKKEGGGKLGGMEKGKLQLGLLYE